MQEQKIKELVKDLCTKKITYRDYEGKNSTTNLIWRENETIVEQIIRQYALDSRDDEFVELKSKIGLLEAKVFMYEQIISKSNFAPMVEIKKDDASHDTPKAE